MVLHVHLNWELTFPLLRVSKEEVQSSNCTMYIHANMKGESCNNFVINYFDDVGRLLPAGYLLGVAAAAGM